CPRRPPGGNFEGGLRERVCGVLLEPALVLLEPFACLFLLSQTMVGHGQHRPAQTLLLAFQEALDRLFKSLGAVEGEAEIPKPPRFLFADGCSLCHLHEPGAIRDGLWSKAASIADVRGELLVVRVAEALEQFGA